MSDTVGRLLSALGVVCALVGVFVMGGISVQFPSILLGAADQAAGQAAGQASGLSGRDRTGALGARDRSGRPLGALDAPPSGLTAPPQ